MVFQSTFRCITNYIKGYDSFGKTFTFTYKGEDQFKTFLGGFVSIIISMVLLVYYINLLIIMFNRGSSDTSVNNIIKDLSIDQDQLDLGNSNFQFAIRIANSTTGYFTQNDSYFSMSLKQYEVTENGFTSQDIGLSV